MRESVLDSGDIPFSNARHRDLILARGAQLLSRTKLVIWYLETLVLSARFMQLLKSSSWGTNSTLLLNRYQLWSEKLIPRIKTGAVVFEFGVAAGAATKWWAKKELPLAGWHGFDTFTGLPTPWRRGGVDVVNAGVFDQSGSQLKFPQVDTAYPLKWHKGLISETLVKSKFRIPSECQKIILLDVDLHGPTKEVLFYFANHLKPGDLIYFDEGFDPWNAGLALQEAINVLPNFTALAHTGSALLIEIVNSHD
jgi:hypothetical protein